MIFLEQFVEWEKKCGLLEDKIDDYYYWYYARKSIYDILSKKVVAEISKQNVAQCGGAVKQLLRATVHNAKYHLRPRKCDIMIIACARRIKKDSNYLAVYTDYLVSGLERDCYLLEASFKGNHFSPAFGKEVEWVDRLDLVPAMKRILYKALRHGIKPEITERATFISDEVKKEFGIEIKNSEIENIIDRVYVTRKYKKPMIERYLKKVSPKLIIYHNHYCQDHMLINEIAKKLKIRTVELQHGLLGNHIAYNYAQNAKTDCLPDEVWLWGKFWKDKCNLPISDNCKIPMGFPHFEKECLTNPPQDVSVNTILFIGPASDELIEFTDRFVTVMEKKGSRFKVYYKAHPTQFGCDKGKWDALKRHGENVEVFDDNSVSIYELFAKSTIQVAISSSAVYEGHAYNLDTYIVDSKYIDYHSDIISEGYASVIKTPDELAECISRNNIPKEKETGESPFFAGDSVNKMLKRIESICEAIE